jgi:GNAT superfamily N-acetyltransferase
MHSATFTCECGHTYVIGHPDDEAHHKEIHAEYYLGPAIQQVRGLPTIKTYREFKFVLVDESVPVTKRRAISHVAMVATRCMPGCKAGYDGADTDDGQRLYLLVGGNRVVGMVLTVFDSRFWCLEWTATGTPGLLDCNALTDRRVKVARVWIAAKHRHTGLASWLVQEVAEHLGSRVQELGWELPFTKGGRSLVKALCPEQFLGCADVFALRQAINSECGSQSAT